MYKIEIAKESRRKKEMKKKFVVALVAAMSLTVAGTGTVFAMDKVSTIASEKEHVLWSSIFVTLMANKIGGLQFGIYRNCQISSRVFHTAVAALPLTKANRSDFE